MSQDGKLKFFAASSYDDEPMGPPPAYSATSHGSHPVLSPLPTISAIPQTKIEEALLLYQARAQEAITRNHQALLNTGTDVDREVRRQLFHLMNNFLGKVFKDSPKSITDLPASVHGVLKADLYIAPQEAVPLSSGWHLSGFSQRDDEIIGRAVQESRVWPTETQPSKEKKEAQANGFASQSRPEQAAGLWSAVDALSLHETVYETRGTLWWNNERAAQELARALELQLLPLPDRLPKLGSQCGEDNYVQIKMRAEEMTFRRENEMGLWESKSGWTIVMAITLLY